LGLTPGTRLGPYDIVAAIGEGGMGEVYRATDTHLKRPVAIKVLPASVAGDAERLARFQREAEVLAALNHPNIAAIYGLEKTPDVTALVMELVEGEDLAAHLARGPIPLPDALAIARQILGALEAAHEKGIIHRDIKPANIMVTADGQAKVLDFGLARVAGADAAADQSNSPTLTAMSTQAGMILGTAAYMSPEQAKGRVADKRSDVWAFGCVLYEMLTGVRAFEGEDVSDTLAAVLRGEPDWTRLPAATPRGVVSLLKRCLTRDRKARIPEISTVRFLLDDALIAPVSAGPASVVVAAPSKPWWRRALPVAIGVVAATFVTGTVAWLLLHARPAAAPQPMRFSIVPAASQPLNNLGNDRAVAISPDGTHLAYVSGGTGYSGTGGDLIVRSLDRLEAEPLRGITNARAPFFSPDGKWIGFFDGQEALKKVPITGGPPNTLCVTGGTSRGATWGPDGTIVFATTSSSGLQVVPAGGGAPKVLTKADPAQREGAHLFPSFLPDGRGILFTIASSPNAGSGETSQVAVLDLKSGQRKILVGGGSQPEYVAAPGGPGYLLYATGGTLRAVRFDPIKYEVLSDPVALVDQLVMSGTVGSAHYAISRDGALVYVSGSSVVNPLPSLVWVDRQGHEEAINAPPRRYATVRVSPDGTRLALDARDQDNDIWIWELARQTLTRLTFDPAPDSVPVWTPDGRRVVFSSARAGASNLYWQPADGTGTVERLTTAPFGQYATSFSPDAKYLVAVENRPATSYDISLMEMNGKSALAPIIRAPFQEHNGDVSPDGRWIAYESTESAPSQIYVRPFPNVNDGRWQISSSGGTKPAWAPSGRELFFIDDKDRLTSVPVQTTPAFAPGTATTLFEVKRSSIFARHYDVAPDGKRFIVIKDTRAAGGDAAAGPPPSLTVVLNWTEELKQRVK
jgi:serine/threonine-protein kinase